MARRVVPALVVAVVTAGAASGAGATDSAGTTERVSVATTGAQARGGRFSTPAITPDGRYITFHSSATNLVPDDTNDRDDVFVHDTRTGVTERVSVATGGGQSKGGSFFPDISDDGRYVVFGSGANNLVAGDTNALFSPTASLEATGRDVFVHDRRTGVTERVSVATAGVEGACLNSAGARVVCGGGVAAANAAISADGRYVAFAAAATNLVAGDTNGQLDIFVHDRQARATTRVSVDSAGAQGTGGASISPDLSADGRYVTFQSAKTNLVTPDAGGFIDVFVHDRHTATTSIVSVSSAGQQGVGISQVPSISADGRIVAFESRASNLAPGDTNAQADIFAHDRVTRTTTRSSVATAGTEADFDSLFAKVSPDGRFVAFDSQASTLVPDDTNGRRDVFVRDRVAGTTTRVTVASRGGGQGNAGSFFPAISRDGRYVAFSSEASNLVPGDTNGAPDVFRHDLDPAPPRVGYWLAVGDGSLFGFGDARGFGSPAGLRLNAPVVAMASTPSGEGYWVAAADGGVFAFGDAQFLGSAGEIRLNHPIVAMAVSPTGAGYWLVAADGGVFTSGDAGFFGSTGSMTLNRPIVGVTATPNGLGYWLVAADGGIFAFGDAAFYGSTGAIRLNQPIVGMAASPTGAGYWFVAADGGIFAYGDAGFYGSTGAITLNQPI
ncbi:MAG: TolB family protein, partial [Acidimicrobiales bacterium]